MQATMTTALPRPAGGGGDGDEILVEMDSIWKFFGAVAVLKGVDLDLKAGEVHAPPRRKRIGQIDPHENPLGRLPEGWRQPQGRR